MISLWAHCRDSNVSSFMCGDCSKTNVETGGPCCPLVTVGYIGNYWDYALKCVASVWLKWELIRHRLELGSVTWSLAKPMWAVWAPSGFLWTGKLGSNVPSLLPVQFIVNSLKLFKVFISDKGCFLFSHDLESQIPYALWFLSLPGDMRSIFQAPSSHLPAKSFTVRG